MPTTNGNKRIAQLPVNTTPTLLDVLPIVSSGNTKQMSVSAFTEFISPYVSGAPENTLVWLDSETKSISSEEGVFAPYDYVLINSNLNIGSDNANDIVIGGLTLKKCGQLGVEHNAFFANTNIVNDGIIKINNGLILSGNTNITGTGIII